MNKRSIVFNEEKFEIVRRTNEENNEFFELLCSAIGKVEEAKSTISYAPAFALNIDAIDKAEKIIEDLDSLCYFAEDRGIFKPVKIDEPVHYYELCYFRGRKDTGSIYIKTKLNAEKFIDDDCFLSALIENEELDADVANDISEINKIDVETYRYMKDY